MMGQQSGRQPRLFYEFCLEDRVPADHLLRKIDRFLLGDLRRDLALFYSPMGGPSTASSRRCDSARENTARVDGGRVEIWGQRTVVHARTAPGGESAPHASTVLCQAPVVRDEIQKVQTLSARSFRP
jgi:hypothetical protein